MRRFFGNLMVFSICLVLGWVAVGCSAFGAPSSLEVGAAVAEAKSPEEKVEEKADKAEESDSESDEESDTEEKAEKSKEEKGKGKESADTSDEDEADDEADDDASEDKKSDESKKKSEKKKEKPHKVKREDLKIEVKLDGVFVAEEMEEIALRPETWSQFKVVEAVEHGSRVKKGDVLVRFNDEKLLKKLAEEAIDQRLGELSLMQDEEEFPRLKRLLELSFEEAERGHEETKADYDYYHATDRPFMIQIANYRYKSAEEQLAAAQEELDQLQQMYEADELTEATEEIVLRRQRFAVETAELVLELGKANRDYTLDVMVPRSDQYYATALEEAGLAFKQAKTAKEIGLTRKSYDMEKKRESRARSVERHGKLLNDKGLMVVRAPSDGVVYYGRCVKGKWSQVTSMKAKLKPFGSVSANTIMMTIVKPGTLHVEASLSEKNLSDFKTGLKATILPAADKELKLEGKVTQVAAVPGASNKFKVELDVDTAKAPEWLVAGLTCDAKVVTYENKEALVVPSKLVQTDEDNEKIKYVMLVDEEEEEPVRRKVKLGRKKGKLVEVLKGLAEGDEIVKEEKKDDDE